MNFVKDISDILEQSAITSIISISALIASIISFITNVLVKDPIERLFKTSLTLFLDYLIKIGFGNLIIISAASFLGQQCFSLFPERNKIIVTIVAYTLIITLFIFLIGFLQYWVFTTLQRTCMKKIRWYSSIFIFISVILGNGIVSGYIWHFGDIKTTLLSIVLFTLLMTLLTSGLLNQELDLIDKNRSQYVLRMMGEIKISSLPHQMFHTQTIAKDIQIFEPSCSYCQNISSRIYYVFYPREQVAIKYTWDKKE